MVLVYIYITIIFTLITDRDYLEVVLVVCFNLHSCFIEIKVLSHISHLLVFVLIQGLFTPLALQSVQVPSLICTTGYNNFNLMEVLVC